MQEVVFLRKLIQSFSGDGKMLPTITFCDNKGTLDLVDNNRLHRRTKHIELRFFYCRKMKEEGHILPARTPTERNLSDDLSKSVDWDAIKDHRFGLHGMDLRPDGTVSFSPVPNPSSKIRPPTPPTTARKVRKPNPTK